MARGAQRLLPGLLLFFVLQHAPARGLRFFLRNRERACFGVSARPGALLNGYAAVENGRGAAALALEIATADKKVFFDRHESVLGTFSVKTPSEPGAKAADWGDESVDEDDAELARYGTEQKYDACLMLTVDQNAPADAVDARRAIVFRLYPAERGETGDADVGGAAVKGETVDKVASALKAMFHEMQGMMRDLQRLQRREKTLVDSQARTARVLAQATVLSIIVLLLTSLFQFSHYKAYFTSKKLC
jgi:emp24/gp25L/p24 family/GOLD